METKSGKIQNENPLLSVAENFTRSVSSEQIRQADQLLQSADEKSVMKIAKNYRNVIDLLEEYGNTSVPEEDRFYYSCPICSRRVFVVKSMSSFAGFPLCFHQQRKWLDETFSLPEIDLD